MRVWSIGEVLWDVFPDQERFGGAPLNVCANLQRMGDSATLFSAVGDDERGRLALAKMSALGLDTGHVRVVDTVPTGVSVVRMGEDGEPGYEIPRPAAFDALETGEESLARLEREAAATGLDWLYFGSLLQTSPAIEQFTTQLAQRLSRTRCMYDMNLRAGHWNLPLVQRLSLLATVVKLNEDEAKTLFALTQPSGTAYSLEEFCRLWTAEHDLDTVCVTLGKDGCAVYQQGELHRFAGYAVVVQDTVGSGDAFAAAFLHGLHQGWPLERSARFANALGALVASRAGATPEWSMDECAGITGKQQGI
jgi:fructokinase